MIGKFLCSVFAFPLVAAVCAAQSVVLNPTTAQSINQPSGTSLNVNRFEGIRFADQFATGASEIGAKINAACLDLPSTGGIIYAQGLTGPQTSSTDWFASCAKPVTIVFGQINLTVGQVGSNSWTIQAPSNTAIIGSGPGVTIFKQANGLADFVRTIATVDGASNVTVRGIEFDGNGANVTGASQQNHGLMFRDCYKCEAGGNYFHDHNGDGIMFHGASVAGTAFSGEAFGTGNGTLKVFRYSVINPQVKPGSVTVAAGTVTATDPASNPGALTGTGVLGGTVNYGTGEFSIQYTTAPAFGQAITISYTGGTGAQQMTSDAIVEDNVFKNDHRADISIISAYKSQIIHNRAFNSYGFESIHCESDGANEYTMDLTIEDNYVESQPMGAGFGGGISCTFQATGTTTRARNVKIAHNTVIGGHIVVQRIIHATVDENTCVNTFDPGGCIQAFGRNYTLTNNTVQGFGATPTGGSTGGIYHDCSSANDTSGEPAGTGDSVISGNKVIGVSLNGIMDFNCSRDVITSNTVRNTQVALANANGIRVSNSIANLSDRTIVAGNQSFDDQTTPTQINGYLIDAGVTNARFIGNAGYGNTTTLLSDAGASAYKASNPGVQSVITDGFSSLVVGTDSAFTSGPRSTWTGSFTSSASPGWRTIPDKPVTVVRFNLQMGTAPVGCTTLQTVQVTDGTAPTTISLANGATTDDAAVTQNYAAGTALTMTLTAGAGCATAAANVNATLQFKMQ